MFNPNNPVYPTIPPLPPITVRVWEDDFGTASVDPTSLIIMTMCQIYNVQSEIVQAYFPFLVDIPSIKVRNSTIVGKRKLLEYIIERTGHNLHFNERQRNKLQLYVKYFMDNFGRPFEFHCWTNKTNYVYAIDAWYTCVIPFPFSIIYLHYKKREFERKFNATTRTHSESFMSTKYDDALVCLEDFNNLLKDGRTYIYHNIPSYLDAVVYSYLSIAMKLPLSNPSLTYMIYRNFWLVEYVNRLSDKYFPHVPNRFKYVNPTLGPYGRMADMHFMIYGITAISVVLLYAYLRNAL